MNPFEEFISQTNENEMTRSQSFDLSNSGFSLSQQHTQVSIVSNAIGYDPARMANFLGHNALSTKPAQKLETIYENLPTYKQNMSFTTGISSNFYFNQSKEQQLSDNKNVSIHGSVSSWNL